MSTIRRTSGRTDFTALLGQVRSGDVRVRFFPSPFVVRPALPFHGHTVAVAKSMPLKSYTWVHRDAILTPAEIDTPMDYDAIGAAVPARAHRGSAYAPVAPHLYAHGGDRLGPHAGPRRRRHGPGPGQQCGGREVRLGHRHVALVNHSQATADDGYAPTFRAEEGFEAAMRRRGLEPIALRVDESPRAGRDAVATLLEQEPRLTAFVTMNEIATFGVVAVLKTRLASLPRLPSPLRSSSAAAA